MVAKKKHLGPVLFLINHAWGVHFFLFLFLSHLGGAFVLWNHAWGVPFCFLTPVFSFEITPGSPSVFFFYITPGRDFNQANTGALLVRYMYIPGMSCLHV